MKTHYKYLAIIGLLTGLYSCEESTNSEQITDTSISGSFSNYAGQIVVVEKLGSKAVIPIDTLDINEDGTFKNFLPIDEVGFYRLRATNNNLTNIVIDKGDNITFSADVNSLEQSASLSGSKEAETFVDLTKSLNKLYVSFDSLGRVMQMYQNQQDMQNYIAAANHQQVLQGKRSSIAKKFIDENPNSMAALAAVENLNIDTDFEYFKTVAENLNARIPNSEFAKSMMGRVAAVQKTAIGQQAPDIALNTPNGELVSLSSLKGQIVMIDFWASWCRPCRMENPNVVKLYKKYHKQGFEIYGVSLDKTQNAWTQAIAQDKLEWIHVSDLKFWNSAAAKQYNVSSIPKTFLIDENGVIIAKNLRGQALENKLAELFNNA